MKNIFIPFILFCLLSSCSNYANFEATIHKEDATKDGIYIDDYVVNIEHDLILELDGKKVRIKGKYIVLLGLNPNDTIVKQGRDSSMKHILKPKIKIIE